MKCYCCDKEINSDEYSEYKLKNGESKVYVCIECDNTEEYYLDKIKRYCLIDGEALDVTKQDEKIIEYEKNLRLEKEEEERLMDCNKSIFYFTNKQGKPPKIYENSYQLIRYCNEFLDINDDINNTDNIQRFTFNFIVKKHWTIPKTWDKDLGKIDVYLNNFKKEVDKFRWYGKIKCEENLYNAKFMFNTENNVFDRVWINYSFMCSKNYKLERKIEELLIKNGFEKLNHRR